MTVMTPDAQTDSELAADFPALDKQDEELLLPSRAIRIFLCFLVQFICSPLPTTANALIVAVGSTVASAATDASGCTPARGRLVRRQHLRGAREGQIRRLAANDGARRRLDRVLAVHDHGAGLRRRQLRGVFGIGEEREIAGTGLFDLRHAANLDGGIALDRAFQAPSQLAERHEIENITSFSLPGLRPGDLVGAAICSTNRAMRGMWRRCATSRNHAVARVGVERKRAPQVGQRRVRRDRPRDLMQPAHRAAPGEKVADDGKREQIAEDIRTRAPARPAPRRSTPGSAGSAGCDGGRRPTSGWRA